MLVVPLASVGTTNVALNDDVIVRSVFLVVACLFTLVGFSEVEVALTVTICCL
jgi:hypothetical protein